jgi:hypothetical protein
MNTQRGKMRTGSARNAAKALLVAGAIGGLALAGLSGSLAKHGDDDWSEGIFASGGSGGSGVWDDDFASGGSGGSGIWLMPGSGGSGGSGWDDDFFDDDWFDD